MNTTPKTNETSSRWRGVPVLITGGTGLIGGWLTETLMEAGARVCLFVRDWDPASRVIAEGLLARASVLQGSVEDCAAVERAIVQHEARFVFHLAAQTLVTAGARDPLGTLETNVRGTYMVLEAVRRQRDLIEGLVIASSDKAYGSSNRLPYTESHPLAGRHPYEVSKTAADLIALAYAESYNLPIVVARCGNVYGGGDLNWDRLVPGTVRSLLNGERPVIRSDGRYRRDYLYVRDVVDAYCRCAERITDKEVTGQAFNFGPAEPRTVLEVVEAIQHVLGTNLEPDIRNAAHGEIRDQYLDSRRAEEFLSWRPVWNFEEGLRETIGWYRYYLTL